MVRAAGIGRAFPFPKPLYVYNPSMSEERETILVWVLVIILIPVMSYFFWKRHGEFMNACQIKHSFYYCWELLH
jgi:hypothetical protein